MWNNYFNRPRQKAWLGAAIGAAVGIGSAIFGASQQKKAQEEQYAIQRATQLRNTGLTSAMNLTRSYANSDELDKEFRSSFKRMGGRKKCVNGGWTTADTDALISGLGSAGSNFATNIIGQAQQQGIYPNAFKPIMNDEKDNNAVYDSANRSQMLNDYYRVSSLRCGGSKMRRK